MKNNQLLYGFHAVGVRLKIAPQSIDQIYIDSTRRDARMRSFVDKVKEMGLHLVEADAARLAKLCGNAGHQGVVAMVRPIANIHTLDNLLQQLQDSQTIPLILVLDGVTDPHNLGACLRVADAAGASAVVAPKDHSAGINATVAKVSSGASESIPYIMVTNLARALGDMKEFGIWVLGTSDKAKRSLYDANLTVPTALVLGAEGKGIRQLTAKTCDELVNIPMLGAVSSLNVSVASGVCLYEVVRQRLLPP